MTVVLLWLFTINLGIAVGAGLYESRVVVPMWRSALPASLRTPDSGLRFWAIATTVPLTLLTIASLAVAAQLKGPAGHWWLIAAAMTAGERAATFGYFIPTMLRLQRSTMAPAEISQRFDRWAQRSWVRTAVDLSAWLLAMRALTMMGVSPA
jgi:hypothetical protein